MARFSQTFFLIIGLVFLTTACGGGAAGGGGDTNAALTDDASNGSSGSGGGSVATGVYVLSWDAVADLNVTGYRAYYAVTPLSNGKILGAVDTALTSLEFTPADYDVAAGTTLYVAVSALGANGLESPVSDQVSIVVQ